MAAAAATLAALERGIASSTIARMTGAREGRIAASQAWLDALAIQTPPGINEAEPLQMLTDRTPVRRSEAVDHDPVAVEEKGDGPVGAAVARGRHIGASPPEWMSPPRAATMSRSDMTGASDETEGAKALFALPADHDMIMDLDVENPGGLDDPAGHLDVRARGCRIARGMIMDEDHGRGGQLQRTPHHFPDVDRGMIHGAVRPMLLAHQDVALVEVEHAKLLPGLVGQRPRT